MAKSTAHKVLDESLEKTYVANTKATNKNSIYDSYIQAFRWASDRLAETKEGGIIAFISNGGWLDGNAMDGMRKCFRQEFSDIYVFNLRGNQRTSGELSRKEGGKIFGSGSRAGITITFLVKNPAKADGGKYNAQIHYCDIGDYLSQKEKRIIVKNFKSVSNAQMQWQQIVPNAKEYRINQRDGLFETLIQCNPQKKFDDKSQTFFSTQAIGVSTNRDVWVYGFSKKAVSLNMKNMIAFYNEQRAKLAAKEISEVSEDAKKISWTVNLRKDVETNKERKFDESQFIEILYRPFCKNELPRPKGRGIVLISKSFPSI